MLDLRWGWVAGLGLAFAAGSASSRQDPERHWLGWSGSQWSTLAPDAQQAYIAGFLTGAALGEAIGPDTAAVERRLAELQASSGFRFPYAPHVYTTRLNDFYWWENHRDRPLWRAIWEVNATLIGPHR